MKISSMFWKVSFMSVFGKIMFSAVLVTGFLFCSWSFAEEAATESKPSSLSDSANATEGTTPGKADNARPVELDRNLKPDQKDEISALFENVVAVQRKAKVKQGSFLFNPYLSFDFSDSPVTMYGLNLNIGYAVSEFFEIYLNYVPSYVANERQIAKKVRDLGRLSSGLYADIDFEKPKYSYGLEMNWAPAYGKDSWGPYTIIRSDTYINFGVSQVKYETTTGMKYKIALGKTFFLSKWFNVRVQAGPSSVETVSSGQKSAAVIGLIESGLVYYF